MHHAVEKVINIARKNPKLLLGSAFFEKISGQLRIETGQAGDRMHFRVGSREATAVIITPDNCQQYKCIVQEGKNGVRIFEYIKALVELLTDEEIPPSPHEKMGQTAIYYCDKGIEILEKQLKGQEAEVKV